MDLDPIVEYYNHFNENKRLLSRHGQVEFLTALTFIKKLSGMSENLEFTENSENLGNLEYSKNSVNSEFSDNSQLQTVKEGKMTDRGDAGTDECRQKENKGANRAKSRIKAADIGAGTGRYSYALAREGFEVTAVELVEHNLDVLRSQKNRLPITSYQGNALDLHMLEDNSFDVTLLFGPMYHLFSDEEKVRALKEALRITKPGGLVFTAYVMNEYSVIIYGFREKNIKACMEKKMLDESFHTVTSPRDLYSYVRLEDIDRINGLALESGENFERERIFSADGPANYIRKELRAMDEEEFELFMRYHLATCERPELLGAGAHTVDVLRKK